MILNPMSPVHQQPLTLIAPPPVLIEPTANDTQAPAARSVARVPRNVSPLAQVSEQPLGTAQERAGNSHNLAALKIALGEILRTGAQDPEADIPALLEIARFRVHSLSTFGKANQTQPNEMLPIAWFLREHSLYVPQDVEQLSNLIDVLDNPLPQPPVQGSDRAVSAQPAAEQLPSPRGVVAGYDLNQPANWGVSPSVVVAHLARHLEEQGKASADTAPAAARALLAGAAPAFIVAGMPDNLVVGSAAWARLSTAVEVGEFWEPGMAGRTDFEAFMRRANQSPISDAQAIVEGKAQSNALIDWGVAQGRISRKSDENYSLAEVAVLREAFNEELSALKKAQDQLSAPMPNRRDMALDELKKAYGDTDPFDVPNISIANIDASESEYHSLLEIYMAGKMERIPKGERYDFQLGNRFVGVKPLPDINQQFSSEFDSYLRNLKEGVTTTVEHQLSKLPLEDRQTIASGKVEFFSLRKASAAQAQGEESAAEEQAAKARYGLLMRVETKVDKNGSDRDPKNIRHVYYEVFPLQGVIRRRDDLPRYLPNPAPRVADPETYVERQAQGKSLWVDYEAYEKGTPAQQEIYSGGLLNEQLSTPYLPELRPGQEANSAVHANPRFKTIAGIVAGHLLHDPDVMKAGARGSTRVEEEEAGIKAGHDFVTGLIPFKNAIENAVNGNTGAAIRDFTLDIFGFVLPFAKGAGQAAKVLGKVGEKLGTRAFKASDALLRSAFNGLNPVDGLGDLTQAFAKGTKNVLQRTYRELKALLPTQSLNLAAYGRAAGNLEKYAVSGQTLAGLSADSQGIYRAADNQLYVRNVDDAGEARVFRVREVTNNQGAVQARVVDPKTNRQTEFLLENNGTDQWSRLGLQGGGNKRPYDQGGSGTQSSTAHRASGAQPAFKRAKVPEAFPGEKADLAPPVKGENVFYHYTGARNHAGIAASRNLDPSSSTLSGEKLPRGKGRHYFTDLAPGDKPAKEISETIFGRRKYGNALDKMTHYYEVNTTGLNVVRSTDNPHIFYVETPFSIPLKYRNGGPDLVDRVIRHGPVPV
ncbi:hypothetical protein LRS56_21420 [Pseudomonas poae]|nr:hypothetical protein LRS56_21420 [Pseudomonas poae]